MSDASVGYDVLNRAHLLTDRSSQIYNPTISINRSALVEVAIPGFNL